MAAILTQPHQWGWGMGFLSWAQNLHCCVQCCVIFECVWPYNHSRWCLWIRAYAYHLQPNVYFLYLLWYILLIMAATYMNICSLDKMSDILKTGCSMVYHHYNLFNKALFGVFYSWGPFYWHGLISAWISNHMPSEVWDEITYPFPNLNGCTFEVWKWISNFIPHNVMHAFTYPCWD